MSTMLKSQETDWLTVEEVAKLLGVTGGRVRQWLLKVEGKGGARLEGRKFGKTWAVSREALNEFLRQDRKPGNPNFLDE